MWRILTIALVIYPFLVHADPKVPCYFIFGDSLSDAGNNNNLVTMAKANYAPYGVDFPQGASGRFTNKETNVDVLTKLLGFQSLIPPFRNATGPEILNGVNYASGAAGILEMTGSQLGDRIWLDRQLLNHLTTIPKLQSHVQGSVSDYLGKCLYTFNIGSDDYINNYFMPQYYPTQRLFNTSQFATLLADKFTLQLKLLYATGARKVAIFGLGKIGCTPAEKAMRNTTQCVDEINEAVKLFNEKLWSVVVQLNSQLPGANFTFINTYAMQEVIPPQLAALISDQTCCKLRSDYQCEPNVPPCSNRDQYAFMDGYHPTHIVNVVSATIAFTTTIPDFVHPVNISRLASI